MTKLHEARQCCTQYKDGTLYIVGTRRISDGSVKYTDDCEIFLLLKKDKPLAEANELWHL